MKGSASGWNGLWWHPEYGNFSSAPIDVSSLPKSGKIRICVKKNPNYNNGRNQAPNYLYSIKGAGSASSGEDKKDFSANDFIEKINMLSDEDMKILDEIVTRLLK